ncbi:cell division protein ZapD [Kangiella sp. TOML190]|uniref:cell division protein ZapD n=1 Tax=Kangiella sp. TOML190 TaxID=2931351 RepID=UPI00203EEAD0|nr:cell division protein ZapD [Kangiella sp. TOML190]
MPTAASPDSQSTVANTVVNNKDSQIILYEFPLNEQVRTYLRLENLLDAQLKLQNRDSKISHVGALHNLLEILDCLDRGDIKGDLLKELEQQKLHFQQLAESPYIDELKLKTFLTQLQKIFQWISHYPGKFGSKLRKERFIELINNRMRIPGGSCSFGLPELHQFLHQPFAQRLLRFEQWFSHFSGLHQCLKILLRLFRENAPFALRTAYAGRYQHNFDKSSNPQMVRIKLDSSEPCFPEVSGSKHCFNIRFLIPNKSEHEADIVACDQQRQFEIAIC